ncbi:hypothetical protein PLICRDRAFT_39935 [Plicaturopsis crispa FD-325 SS-3]|nr:hypothetical protein PLICRDRAFT_39935 [Plicaturopsis crispa FD-325 SS-3]
MPAERSYRASKRCSSAPDAGQLTWTAPVEPVAQQSSNIAFAPNVTPVSFSDPFSADSYPNSPSESVLFPSSPSDSTASGPTVRRPTHSKKKPENHIPRPPNAFILFRSSFIKGQHVSTDVETNHSTLSKIIGLTWQNLPPEERAVWHAKAKAALDDHKRRFPQYAFRPTHPKKGGGSDTAPEKRKVREVGPKDLKRCTKIAELLVEGKKGQELDAAIQEFDRHHVPEVVTRFEAPLTARMYRRSSSAPVAETEHEKESSAFLPAAAAPRTRRARASSSRPVLRSTPSARDSSPAVSEAESQFSQAGSDSSSDVFYDPTFQNPYASQAEYSFPSLKPDPSFDFNAYSFDEPCTPSPCDPSIQTQEGQSQYGMFAVQQEQQQCYQPVPLTINTAFMANEWASNPSPYSAPSSPPYPMTPTTPAFGYDPYQLHSSPTSDGFDIHSSDGLDAPMLETYGASSASCDDVAYNAPYDFAPSQCHPNDFSSADCFSMTGKPELASLDMDFSAFMSSIPQYTL